MNNSLIAMVCHEANRAYCLALGDMTQPRWEDAPNWQRDSAVKGVVALLVDPSLTPEQLHANWYQDKVKDGWVYGPVKNAEAKTHPNLVLYSQLSNADRKKDYLFQAVVRVLAELPAGYVHP